MIGSNTIDTRYMTSTGYTFDSLWYAANEKGKNFHICAKHYF